jgi:hypothetical protein
MSGIESYLYNGGDLGPLAELFLCTSLGAQTRLVSTRNEFVNSYSDVVFYLGKVVFQITKASFSIGMIAVGLLSIAEGIGRIATAILVFPIFCLCPNINRLPMLLHNLVKLGFVSGLTGVLAFPTALVAPVLAFENIISDAEIDVDAHYNSCVAPSS